ncbi:MAG: potassium/proton antiporter [Bdellovibrionia bacterium]
MHSFNLFLIGCSALLLLSVLASQASGVVGIPSLVFFIGIGMLAGSDGPGGFYFNDPHLTQAIGIIALILILFSGGLDTSWPRVRPVLKSAFALATLGLVITSGLVAAFAVQMLHFTWIEGMLLGAIVSSTDAAAVFAVLEGKKIGGTHSPIKPLLELESGSNDSMAAFLTVGMIHILDGHPTSGLSLTLHFLQQMTVGLFVGMAIGKLATEVVNRVQLESEGIYPVITTSMVMLSYGVSEVLGGNGFLTVYVVGIVMGNSRVLLHKRSLMLFHDGLGWLMQIAMFLTLGLLVFPRNLLPIAPVATGLAVFLILIARPLGVFLALLGSRLHFREKVVISWAGLRGAAPIVLATYPLLARIPKAQIIFDLVFFIVLTSVVIQGTTIPYLGKWMSKQRQARLKAEALIAPAS